MSRAFASCTVRFVALTFVLASFGCSRGAPPPSGVALPTAAGLAASATAAAPAALALPGGPEQSLFVDLAVGRGARLETSFRTRIIPTGGLPGEWTTFAGERSRTVTGEIQIAGVPYRIERNSHVQDGTTYEFEDAWRQDRSGLYLYDIPGGAAGASEALQEPALALPADQQVHAAAWRAAARAIAVRREAVRTAMLQRGGGFEPRAARAGGPGESEITFLRYPLHPGASWEGRIGFNVWTVEAREALLTPAGRFPVARLRIELPGIFGPNDRAITWWGAPGEVAHAYRFEAEATDEGGQVIGTMQAEDDERLVGYDPAGR